jgi:hypothetical protein
MGRGHGPTQDVSPFRIATEDYSIRDGNGKWTNSIYICDVSIQGMEFKV